MKRRKVQLFLSILICLSVVSTYGDVVYDEQVKFKMTVDPGAGYTVFEDEVRLSIGGLVTVDVWAWVDSVHGTAGNGLDTWQVDLGVDTSGVIGITETAGGADISIIAPAPLGAGGWYSGSVNSPVTGEAREINASLIIGATSETGIGDYSKIFSFQIEALAEGTARYTIMDDGGELFYASLVDFTEFEDGGVDFDAAASDNVFHVVPEPCSLMILSGLSLIAFRRRRGLG